MMNPFNSIKFKKAEGIGCITLDRPKALNAFNIQMRDELFEILQAVRDDDEIKVVILNGAGEKAFCTGADLSEFLTAPNPTSARKIRFERDLWGLMLQIPQPLIASLHGYVLGSGIEMALCCDIRICSDNALMGLPEVKLGMIPAAGGTQTLPRIIGTAKAVEMLLSDNWFSAEEAYQVGLVNRLVPYEDLWENTWSAAQQIASYDTIAVKLCKQAIVRGQDLTLAEGLALEDRLSKQVNVN